jgi:hypothetical protein
MNSPIDEVLSRLDNVSGSKGQYNAACPCRADDKNPSLRVGIGREDQVLLKCLRGGGCSVDDICKSINLEMTDLWPEDGKENKVTLNVPKTSPVPGTRSGGKGGEKKLTNTYKYFSADGTLIMEVLRYVYEDGRKTFLQRKPAEQGGWEWKTDDLEKPLYRLPQILRAVEDGETVWIVEGEKDVDTLVENFGLQATTNPGGAGGAGQNKWMSHHSNALAGSNVVIVVDNDEPGYRHAVEVRQQLWDRDCKVKVFQPGDYKDVSDLVADGLNGSLISALTEIDPLDLLPPEDDGAPEPTDDHVYEDQPVNGDDSINVEVGDEPLDKFMLEAALIKNTTSDPIEAATAIRRAAGKLLMTSGSEMDTGKAVKWNEFLEEDADTSYDWIIPNLLERGDRVMVVASEGAGKTTLARQVAMMTSAGIHPFRRTPMDPLRTLMIDLENPERIIRRATGKIYDRIKAFGQEGNMDGAHLVMKPDGVNLLTARDQAMIEEHVANTNPDILFFGPIYKSFLDPGGKTAEAVCGEIVRFLDYIRVQYDCALWLEHHAPLGDANKRDMRPFGSAVWSRWSEFGIALTPDIADPALIQFNHYRGQREKREWPLLTKRGATWPFEVVEWAETDEDAQIAQQPQRTDEEMNRSLAEGVFDSEVSPW